jgi:hypothetical protein
MLGLQRWDEGQAIETQTAGGKQSVTVYRYNARLEVFGKVIDCPVHLADLPTNPLYVGLLGREGLLNSFGFGFWESTTELLATVSP